MSDLASFFQYVCLATGICLLMQAVDRVIKAVSEIDTMVRSHIEFYEADVAYERLGLRTVTQSSPKVRLTCRRRHRP